MITNRFEGKIAAITGGAGDIGKVIALALISEGANVSIGDINYDEAKKVAKDVYDIGPGRAEAFLLDVTSIDSISTWIDKTVEKFGRLDILINTAAIMSPVKPSLEVTEEEWEKTHTINLKGVLFCKQRSIIQIKRQ